MNNLKNNRMIQKIRLIVVLAALAGMGTAYAQVTVGSGVAPATGALLEIKSQAADASNVTSTTGGLGLPRVSLVSLTTLDPFIASATTAVKTNHTGLMVYNLNTTAPFSKGVYVWDGTTWGQVGAGASTVSPAERFFYLPSFNISLAAVGTTVRSVNLYNQYKNQFTKDGNASFVANPTASALTTVPCKADGTLYAASELNYIVTYYDATIITITGITNAGVMSYTVDSHATTSNSYINVICVIK